MPAKHPPAAPARDQELLDEALAETFPASGPPALVIPGGGITRQPTQLRTRRKKGKAGGKD